jgi:hypothetical protein
MDMTHTGSSSAPVLCIDNLWALLGFHSQRPALMKPFLKRQLQSEMTTVRRSTLAIVIFNWWE